jgi:hypothetical protein
MTLHPQFIEQNGKKAYAILPYEEFVAMNEALEDALDQAALNEAKLKNKGGKRYTHEEVMARILAKAND